MGMSAGAYLFLGCVVGSADDCEDLPGYTEEEGWDFDHWWNYEVHEGFEPSSRPYTEEGNYVPGVSRGDPRIDTYYAEKREYEDSVPECPAEVVFAGHHEVPTYCLAVRGTAVSADYSPTEVESLAVSASSVSRFKEFLKEYFPDRDLKVSWLLVSDWG